MSTEADIDWTSLAEVLRDASGKAVELEGPNAELKMQHIVRSLLRTNDSGFVDDVKSTFGMNPREILEQIEQCLADLPQIQIGIEMPMEADVFFCSVFAGNNPGASAKQVVEAARWPEGSLGPISAKQGFDILDTEGLDGGLEEEGRIPLVAVASHTRGRSAEKALPDNLKKAIENLKIPDREQKLWLPLMGSGAGQLTPIHSLNIMVGAMREGGLFDKMKGGKITFSVGADQADALPELQEYLKDIFPSYIDPKKEHEKMSTEQRALFKSELKNDQASNEDHLGHEPIVRALDEFLRADGTRPPLVIGIDAPWGAGKSSVMRMLRDRLQEDAEYNVEEGLAKAAAPLDWKDATNLTKEAAKEQTEIDEASDKPPRKRNFETVYFNAWRHGDGERLTANLVNTVIESISAQKGEAFWLRLNLNRFDLQEIKLQFFLKFVAKSVSTLIGLAFFATVASFGFVQFGFDVWYGNATFFGGGIACLAFIGNAWRKFRNSPVDVSVEQYFRVPDYNKLRGAQSEIEDDFRRVLNALKQEDAANGTETMLVIFIDDLDRCGPTATAKIVETINVFFGQETENCIFVLGMHKHMVAASLELAYERLTKHAKNDPALAEELPFGRRFLEKIVQFHVRIPEPNEQDVERYLAYLTGTSAASALVDRDLAILRAYAETADEDATIDDAPAEILQRLALPVPEQKQATDKSALPPPQISDEERAANEARQAALKEQFDGEKRMQRAIKLDEKDLDILRVFNAVKFALRKNPRQYVRFLNALRFANFLDSFDHRERSGTAAEQILDLAKREVLALEWPELHALLLANNADFEEFFSEVRVGPATPGRLSEFLSDVIGLDADDSFATATIDRVLSDKLLIDLAAASID